MGKVTVSPDIFTEFHKRDIPFIDIYTFMKRYLPILLVPEFQEISPSSGQPALEVNMYGKMLPA